jgi:hypothetical protein
VSASSYRAAFPQRPGKIVLKGLGRQASTEDKDEEEKL